MCCRMRRGLHRPNWPLCRCCSSFHPLFAVGDDGQARLRPQAQASVFSIYPLIACTHLFTAFTFLPLLSPAVYAAAGLVARHTTITTNRLADDVLLAGVRSVTDLMTNPGLINLDFADVSAVMQGMGNAMMGTGEAEGDDRATRAADDALNNPLLGELSAKSAKGLLVNITGGADLTLLEVDAAAARVTDEVEDATANIIFGSSFDPALEGRVRVSVVATGIDDPPPSSSSFTVAAAGLSHQKGRGSGVAAAERSGAAG
ncbi:unnamed protein product [Phaeothamnion confervicola]